MPSMITRRSGVVHETQPSAVVHDEEQTRDELEAEMQEVESEVQKLQAQLAHLQYPETRQRSDDSRAPSRISSSDIHRKASASDFHRTPSEGEIVRRLSLDVNSVVVETKRKDLLTNQEGAHGDKVTSRSRSGGPPGPEEDEDHKGEKVVKFEQAPHDGLTAAQAEALLLKWGKNELQEKITPWYVIVFRLLTGPMPIMLWIAALVEAIIGAYADMGILLAIQFTNAGISFYETTKAGNAVAALKASLQPKATVKRDGKWFDIDATLIVPGDLVLLAAGSAVPADCYVNDGEIEVDQSAMTGESLPVKMRRGNVCKLGSNVVRGETEGTVETTGEHTFFGKTASMLQSVNSDGGSLQILLLRIMLILVSLSLTLCIIALIFLIVEGRKQNEFRPEAHRKEDSHIVKEALSFAVVVLVASIPLAIEIVTTTTLALGSKDLSAKGCIVTRLSAIEEMAGMDMLCSDKTGTLTLNKMVIQNGPGDCPIYTPGETYESVLFQAALAAKWKEPPRDALDTMVLVTSGQDLKKCDAYEQLDFTPFDPRTKRTEGKLKGRNGKIFRITKGAPHVILGMCRNKEEIHDAVEAKVHELGTKGIRSLALARMDNEDGRWRMLGILTFLDPPRPDTKQTIEDCHKYGVAVKMITGDHLVIAKETARQLGMGQRIYPAAGLPMLGDGGAIPDGLVEEHGEKIIPADGFAGVFPEHKFLIVETLRQAGFRCGMTGDGVNDAPALKRADVGIAVQGATDAARAAADLVLTGEGLSTIIDGIEIAREIFSRLKNFISYRIAATLQLLTFFFIAVFAFPPQHYYMKNGFEVHTKGFEGEIINIPRQSWHCQNGWVREHNLFVNVNYENPQAASRIAGCESIVLPICSTLGGGHRRRPQRRGVGGFATPKDDNPGYDASVFESHQEDEESHETVSCQSWPNFFQLPVLMLMLITLLNDGALISVGYDIVQPSPIPEQWNLVRLFIVAIVMGGVAMGSSLLLLAAALDSNSPSGIFAGMGLPPMEYGKIVCMIYLKVALSDFLTLFSCRTQLGPFWTVKPGVPLMIAVMVSLIISTFLASYWPEGELDGLPVKGLALGQYTLMPLWIWIYCILWWFIQDALKVLTFWGLNHYNIFPNTLAQVSDYEKDQV